MTAHVWQIGPDQITLACDTQLSDPDTHAPTGHASKLFVIPHRGLILAAMGFPQFGGAMLSDLLFGNAPTNMADVLTWAPERLDWVKRNHPALPAAFERSRVGLFGLDEDSDRLAGYLFQADGDMQAEPLPDGCMCSPSPVPDDTPNDLRTIMLAQRELNQKQRFPGKPSMIGGRIMVAQMVREPGAAVPSIILRHADTLPAE